MRKVISVALVLLIITMMMFSCGGDGGEKEGFKSAFPKDQIVFDPDDPTTWIQLMPIIVLAGLTAAVVLTRKKRSVSLTAIS